MGVQRKGERSWLFSPAVSVVAGAAVCGPREGVGPLGADFDRAFPDLYMGQASFEKAEQFMQEEAVSLALKKASLREKDVDVYFAGDLINQITPSGFTARSVGAAYLGLFSACATIGEALSLGALTVAAGAADTVLASASSHTCTAERQFRYPTEYGGQKPPYSQSTATLAGAAVLRRAPGRVGVAAATIGRVRDEKITDAFQMGAAMAPAFADTVAAHLRDLERSAADYDLIVSGDLGRIGTAIARELLAGRGVRLREGQLADCGLLLMEEKEKGFAGYSGCGCAAGVGLGHLLGRLRRGELRRVLLCPTGALLSPLSVEQKESIPAVCHAVVLERTQ